MNWTYPHGDPAILLWTAAVKRFGLDLPDDARVLELGCAETDWLERMHAQNQAMEFIGVDTRREQRAANGFELRQGDARQSDLFAGQSFDAVVLLGALEHFGLGFYGDPVDDGVTIVDGDCQTMSNIADWLKPGGWVYFDVPANPTYSIRPNRHFRTYSPAAVTERLIAPSGLTERCRAYSLDNPADQWCDEPTVTREPYYYCAVVADKARGWA